MLEWMMYMWTHTHYRVSPPYKSQPESYCLTVPVSSLSIQHVQVRKYILPIFQGRLWYLLLSYLRSQVIISHSLSLQIALAASCAAAQAGIIASPSPYGLAGAGLQGYALPAVAAPGYAPLPTTQYAAGYAYGAAPLAYGAAPVAYGAAPIAHAPIAHASIAPVAAQAYALPPVRNIEEAPIVEQLVEPVEQHGYSVRY